MEGMRIFTTTTSDGKTYTSFSTGNGTGDVGTIITDKEGNILSYPTQIIFTYPNSQAIWNYQRKQ